MITSYDTMPLSAYEQVRAILRNDALDDADVTSGLIAALTGTSVEAVDALPIGDYAALAASLHYDLPYLSRLVRQTTGKNYTELLQEKRLSQAAWLLRNTGKRVDEIANAVGYENLSYFHRLFAARFGQSPKKYRDCK